jgi:PleD family two-component response regulator
LQIIDFISNTSGETEILDRINVALDNVEDPDSEKLTDKRILIVEKDRVIGQRLKDILTTKGYEAHCAFNARQALDMAIGYKPLLALINMNMSIDGKSLITHFRYMPDTANIPVIAVTDQPVPFFFGESETVKVLSPQRFAQLKQPISIEMLASEVIQVEAYA